MPLSEAGSMAPNQVASERLLRYDAGETGITVDVTLRLVERNTSFVAKVDTGASYRIFERKHGEALGLTIEAGLFQPISTAIGRFITYGHEVTLLVASFEFDSM